MTPALSAENKKKLDEKIGTLPLNIKQRYLEIIAIKTHPTRFASEITEKGKFTTYS